MKQIYTPIRSWAREILEQKYNVLQYFNVLDIDYDFSDFETWLEQNRLEHYNQNDVYVLDDQDQHYYLPHCPYSLTWHNIIKIFLRLDIPTGQIIIITNGIGLEDELQYLLPKPLHKYGMPKIIDVETCPFGMFGADWGGDFISNFINNNPVAVDTIEKQAMSMMGVPRIHRNILYNYLCKHKLLDKVAVSYNNHPGKK